MTLQKFFEKWSNKDQISKIFINGEDIILDEQKDFNLLIGDEKIDMTKEIDSFYIFEVPTMGGFGVKICLKGD